MIFWGALLGALFASSAVVIVYFSPAARGLAAGLVIASILDFVLAALVASRLIRGRGCRLALFRDRVVVVQRRLESSALWDRIEAVTLAEPEHAAWPRLRPTGTLTIHVRQQPALRFAPADFGVDPVRCRDMIVRLRDHQWLRRDLPEFDSALDLHSGRRKREISWG
jgi:hypothetical protein